MAGSRLMDLATDITFDITAREERQTTHIAENALTVRASFTMRKAPGVTRAICFDCDGNTPAGGVVGGDVRGVVAGLLGVVVVVLLRRLEVDDWKFTRKGGVLAAAKGQWEHEAKAVS